MERSKILLVEDELALAKGLRFNLESEGYDVCHCSTAEEAQTIFGQYDLIILDLMLPGMNGFELLEIIRKTDFCQPVLILSAKSADDDVVRGLQLGADDYVIKPFSLPQLLLRIKRLLQRSSWQQKEQANSYSFNGWFIDFDNLKASRGDEVITLTQFENTLLRYLISHRERIVSRDELLKNVWGYEQPPKETRTVDIFMGRLRKIFETDSKNPRYFISVRGAGYKFEE